MLTYLHNACSKVWHEIFGKEYIVPTRQAKFSSDIHITFSYYRRCLECVVCGRCGAPLVSLEPHTCSTFSYRPDPSFSLHLADPASLAANPNPDAHVVSAQQNRILDGSNNILYRQVLRIRFISLKCNR